MKILSIGNSFSQDAHRYIYDLAHAEGEPIKAVNLYIGGCSLRTHYINMLDDNKAYSFEFNGKPTGLFVSIREALASDDWDVVTLQQVSGMSIDFATYTPYLEALADFVRDYCPHAKLYIHETWPYEAESAKLANLNLATPKDMYEKLHCAYIEAAKAIDADGIIPSGAMMLAAIEKGLAVHRDSFHASRGFGRLLLAHTWYKTLFGKQATAAIETDEPVTDEEFAIISDLISKL